MQHQQLTGGWQLKQRTAQEIEQDLAADGWIEAAVPGSVQEALLGAGRIPDPFIGTNETEIQWIGEQDWIYRCVFTVGGDMLAQPRVDLCLDGLDTFATVWLNGEQIAQSDNMFLPLRVNCTGKLREGENELRILFLSPLRVGREREAADGTKGISWNGETSRLFVRKAQYHYGWDWGPQIMAVGPWKAVRLEAYAARVADIHCPAAVAEDLASATLPVRVQVEQAGEGALDVRLALLAPDGATLEEAMVAVADGAAQHTFHIDTPQLWWPHGYGAQPRYRLVATLLPQGGGEPLDARDLALGLRRVQLVQEPVAGENQLTSFYFTVNNTPIFAGGADWIPDDIPSTRVTAERYRAQVRRMVQANMAMVRVWGGGIYEDEAFYEACDEQGLLVWQDFMFACGLYPAPEWLLQSVRAEAEAQVRRLRHHASIVLWCGNNEDYSVANRLFKKGTAPEDNPEFPARRIYEQVLPEVCAALDGTVPYWPGSPYNPTPAADDTQGDLHVWVVWHGDKQPYQRYPELEARFISEFGLAAFPAPATVAAFAPGESSPDSAVIQHHQKGGQGQERIVHYLAQNTGVPSDLDAFIYASQLVQAEALTWAFAHWRRRWGADGRRAVGGALVWQFNDCWPTMSWALLDYSLRAKAALHSTRRALAPLSVGIHRAGSHAETWVASGRLEPVQAAVELTIWGLDGEHMGSMRRQITVGANQVIELGSWPNTLRDDQVLAARLLVDGQVVSRFAAWPDPLKDAPLADPQLAVRAEGEAATVSATRPAKGVWLSASPDQEWSDNSLDVMPRDPQTVQAPSLGGKVKATSLYELLQRTAAQQ